jgi:hypothetical protein
VVVSRSIDCSTSAISATTDASSERIRSGTAGFGLPR